MGKKKPRITPEPARKPSRFILKSYILLIYFTTVLMFISTIVIRESPLCSPRDALLPPYYLFAIHPLYYIFPIVLALIFGVLFPPFLKNFRDILFPIFYIAIIYSFTTYMFRSFYAEERSGEVMRGQYAKIEINNFSHAFSVNKKDGTVDTVDFTARFAMAGFPPGDYRLTVLLTDYAETPASIEIGTFNFPVNAEEGRIYVGHFKFVPPKQSSGPEKAEYDVGMILQRSLPVDEYGKKVLAFTRWSPFFRTTNWNGADPEIKDEIVTLDVLKYVDYFSLHK